MANWFNNPMLLWFLPLLAVPILLHLITLYRLRTVDLSTFRFLMDSYVQQRRRMRLLEWLLMLLRTVFVGLMIFALSRPELYHLGWLFGSATSGEVLLIVDAAPTMALRSGGISSLERAQGAARQVVQTLGADSRVTVVRAADRAEVIGTRFAAQRDTILEQTDHITVGAAGGDISAVLGQLFAEHKTDAMRRIYIVTDAQRARWRGLRDSAVLKHLAEATQVVLIDVGPNEPVVNLAVTGDPPQALRPVVGLPVLLSATVVNCSMQQNADTVLSVMLDDEQVHRLHLSLQPGEKVQHHFTVTPARSGMIRGRFELPKDAFSDDDAYLFCLNVEPTINVLLVTQPAGEGKDRPDLFLESALQSPLTSSDGGALADQQLAAAITVTTITPDKLNAPQLEQADTVVLADVPLNAEQSNLLRAYVESSGGVFVMPGPGINPQVYHGGLLGPVAGATGPVMHLGEPVGDPEDESTFKMLSHVDLKHPVFSAFDDPDGDYFGTTRLYRTYPISWPNPGSAAPGDRRLSRPIVLMRLTDNKVVQAEAQVGQGRILLTGFPGTPQWSNLPLKPEFVPMLLRAVTHLRRPAPASAPATVTPNRPAAVRLTDRWSGAQVQVLAPDGKPHTLEMHRSGRSLVGAMRQTDRKGYYAIEVLPRTSGAPERVELGFAVNLEATPTDFAKLDETALREIFAPVELSYVQSVPDDPVLAERLSTRREIWRGLIALMFCVMFLEFLLATLRPSAAPASGEDESGTVVGRLAGRIGGVMNRVGIWVAMPKGHGRATTIDTPSRTNSRV